MRQKHIVLTISVIFILAGAAVNCDRNMSPLSSELPQNKDTIGAVLTGTVDLGNSQVSSFSAVKVGVKDTNLVTTPNDKGDFTLKNIPPGDIALEVTVQTTVSDISIENVKTNDLIEAVIEVLAGNRAALVQMNKYSDNNDTSNDVALELEIRPDRWSTDWSEDNSYSTDEVIAKISGKGFDRIDYDSVRMTYMDEEIKPYEYDLGDRFFIAKFHQYEAISLIPDPKRGETPAIFVTGEIGDNGETFELSAAITIVGEKPAGELSLEIRPDRWNTAWSKSEGVVLAMFSGEGFDEIPCDSVEMSGENGESISFHTCSLSDSRFIVKFKQKEVIDLIPADAGRGDTCDITVSGTVSGEDFSFTRTITIVN
ncbi:MAG: hypothetical protein R6V02_00440 [Candidatus Aminicenantes bacterium]